MALLEQLHKDGKTIILITHDSVTAAHAKRIIRVKDGEITTEKGRDTK